MKKKHFEVSWIIRGSSFVTANDASEAMYKVNAMTLSELNDCSQAEIEVMDFNQIGKIKDLSFFFS